MLSSTLLIFVLTIYQKNWNSMENLFFTLTIVAQYTEVLCWNRHSAEQGIQFGLKNEIMDILIETEEKLIENFIQ